MQSHNMSFCHINGYKIAYSCSGAGEAVLLVHGITTYSFIWRKIVPFLETKFKVYIIDLPGCGASSKELNKKYSIKNHAHLLKSFLDKVGVKKCHMVGHDVGGGIVQIFSVNYPERVIDLTLVNSVAYDFWPVQPIIAMRTPIIRQFAMATLDFGALRMIVRRGLYHSHALTTELMELFWEPMKTKEGRRAFLHFASSLDNKNLMEIAEDLHKLNISVMIIRGDKDPYLSEAISEKLAANIPLSKLVHIESGSHFLQEDEPKQVADELLQFFQESA